MDNTELKDIIISWFALSLAFMIAVRMVSLEYFLMFLFIIGVSFITHELAHRQVAKRLGFSAKFEMWPTGLLIAIVSSLGGFIFAAPGAVVISAGLVGSREKMRDASFKISAAGPVANIILGAILLYLVFVFNSPILFLAAQINIWLAIFNLLPFPPLDGSKIFNYNPKAWVFIFLIAIGLFGLMNFI
ncbi:MAG: site-2 protease family protein [Candidatus Aenigmarchaeota archaeon]|nr:site-2 protease family protein [Candidatus Aenigmarchaeota archaeon]